MKIESAEDYEAAVLRALSLRPEQVPWARWARAYEALSSALTEAREEVLVEQASGELGDADTRAVAALVFGARSFVVARAIAIAYPPPSGTVIELGAGCGPFGLAAASLGYGVELVDAAAESLAMAPALFEASGLPAPRCSVGSAQALSGSGFAAIALAFSLNEMLARSPSATAESHRWISSWMSKLMPGGRLYLLEPGTKAQSRQLQALRDEWRAHVLAPCTQTVHGCPLLLETRDWCHFTWPHAAGPVTQRLAQMTGRDARHLRFSWLVLEKVPVPFSEKEKGTGTSSGSGRLLELRYGDRHKASGVVCCSQGEVIRLTALKRDREAYAALTELVPGAVLSLDREGLEAKGDGLRVRSPEELLVQRPL